MQNIETTEQNIETSFVFEWVGKEDDQFFSWRKDKKGNEREVWDVSTSLSLCTFSNSQSMQYKHSACQKTHHETRASGKAEWAISSNSNGHEVCNRATKGRNLTVKPPAVMFCLVQKQQHLKILTLEVLTLIPRCDYFSFIPLLRNWTYRTRGDFFFCNLLCIISYLHNYSN